MRLFVAARPPADVLDALADLPRPAVPGIRWTTRDQWHVTLRFLGWMPEVDPAVEALRSLRAPVAEAVLGPAVAALGRAVLMAPVAGLERVAAEVVDATVGVGQPPEDRPFTGHVTLARAARGSVRPLAGAPVAGRWSVDEVLLVRSHLSRAGARYEPVAAVPLTPGSAGP